MTTLELFAVLTQLLIPIAFILWVAFSRHRTPLALGVDVAMAAAYLIAIGTASPWLAVPWYLPAILAIALIAASVVGWSRIRPSNGGAGRRLAPIGLGARALAAVGFAAVAALALSGRQPFPEPATDLVFPLRQGEYLVANGGTREIVNPHLRTRSGDRYRDYRGQSYAVDIVKVGAWGSRRAGLSPADPGGFAIFGDSIHAPCSGVVIRAADGLSDRLSFGAEPRTLEGNHVLLECGAVWILLAHMQHGSVQVVDGQSVMAGDLLGLVGNSGRSDEPHLHLHAQTPGTREAPLSGDPVPVTFAGRHLVRNDRIREE